MHISQFILFDILIERSFACARVKSDGNAKTSTLFNFFFKYRGFFCKIDFSEMTQQSTYFERF